MGLSFVVGLRPKLRARAAVSTPCAANHAVIILACASTFTVSDGVRCSLWSLSTFPVFRGALSVSSHLLSLFHFSMRCRVRNIKSIPDRVRRRGAKLFAVRYRQGLQANLSREKYVGGKQPLGGGGGFFQVPDRSGGLSQRSRSGHNPLTFSRSESH